MNAIVRPQISNLKQTECGLIPAEWETGQLGDRGPFVTSGSRGWAKYYSETGCAFLRITNLSRDSIYVDVSDLKLVRLPPGSAEGLRTELKVGDLLISITADIGIIGYVDPSVPRPAYINQHIALVRFDRGQVDSKFLSYFLSSEKPQRAFRAGTDQGAKAGMSLTGIRAIRAVFPPTSEQHAIAAALSDVDALLAKLDALIAKKRDLNQAAMQRLLTGNIRLPGFTGQWEIKTLGELATIKDGTHQTPTYAASGVPFFSVEQVTSGDFENVKFITENEHRLLSRACKIERDDILMTRIGSIGDCKLIDWDVDASFYVSLALLKVRAGYSPAFIAQYSNSADFKREVELHSLLSAIPKKINLGAISNIEIKLPSSLDEQTAIAALLSDCAAEIRALEARRAKTHSLKQGMMQELLTGRIRLI